MSNPNVGNVYQQIIRDVIDTSRVDFEEGGVDEGVLDELARVSFRLFLMSNQMGSNSMRISWVLVAFLFDIMHIPCRCYVVFAATSLSWCSYMRALLALLGSGSDENQNRGGHLSVFVCLFMLPGNFDSLRLN